jgi:hypothetical protein
MDLNKHKYFMLQILRDIYSDLELANFLGFKGGTCHKNSTNFRWDTQIGVPDFIYY